MQRVKCAAAADKWSTGGAVTAADMRCQLAELHAEELQYRPTAG